MAHEEIDILAMKLRARQHPHTLTVDRTVNIASILERIEYAL